MEARKNPSLSFLPYMTVTALFSIVRLYIYVREELQDFNLLRIWPFTSDDALEHASFFYTVAATCSLAGYVGVIILGSKFYRIALGVGSILAVTTLGSLIWLSYDLIRGYIWPILDIILANTLAATSIAWTLLHVGYITVSPTIVRRHSHTICISISLILSIITFYFGATAVGLSDYRPTRATPQVYLPPYTCTIDDAPHTFSLTFENDKIQLFRCGHSASLIHEKRSRYFDWFTPQPQCRNRCVIFAGLPTAIPKDLCPQFIDVGYSHSQFTYWPCSLRDGPTSKDLYFQLGSRLYKRGYYKEAIGIWRDEYLSDTQNIYLSARISEAYMRVGDYKKADAYLSQAITFNQKQHLDQLQDRMYVDKCFIDLKERNPALAMSDCEAVSKKGKSRQIADAAFAYIGEAYAMSGNGPMADIVSKDLLRTHKEAQSAASLRNGPQWL